MIESKIRIIFLAFVAVSFSLHLISISVIGYLGSEVAKHQQQISKLLKSSRGNFKQLFDFRNQSTQNAETVNQEIKSLQTIAGQNSELLEETVESPIWLKSEVDKIWRIGCPLGGMSNGSQCYVLERDRLNYTDAVDKCEERGGQLAILENDKILERLYETFPVESFFVDARYNDESGKWFTSKGTEATFLPQWMSEPQYSSNGSCIYVHRKSFNRWHCYALMFYLCAF
uniref:uncharacterized protein LOC120328864 isoform X1 n=1 Tax=Styela clava TaxID=7725 RepID=UPI0019399413|nr:uncharacterized protein LOC120328864 isoform X1 [Styela clava]